MLKRDEFEMVKSNGNRFLAVVTYSIENSDILFGYNYTEKMGRIGYFVIESGKTIDFDNCEDLVNYLNNKQIELNEEQLKKIRNLK